MKKYEKIINDVIEKLKSGELKKGDKLPSLRELVDNYTCNKSTVIKAIDELKNQNLVYSLEKSGYYILGDFKVLDDEVDFADSLPDSAQFPFGDFKVCINEVLEHRDAYLFDYYDRSQGLVALGDSFKRLLTTYGVYANMDNILNSSGAQQAIYILSVMDMGEGKDTILIEQPTYHRMNELIVNLGLKYESIDRTLDGIDLARLERLFARGDIKYFYTIPRLSNPLGASYSEAEKERIVELANRYDVYILEDDYMADFSYKRSAPMHYYDTADKVIYVKSFSNIIFPSIRMATVVMPDALLEEFLKMKSLMDYDSNLLLQKALSTYIDNGMFAKHSARLSALYKEKHDRLKSALIDAGLNNALVFDTKTVFKIKDRTRVARLKTLINGRYKVDFMEDNYIARCPYDYVKIDVRNIGINDIARDVGELVSIIGEHVEF